jgi:hypothetical protein
LSDTGQLEIAVDEVAVSGRKLIVMGTHGRRGLAHLLIGSVAEQMLRTAPCPVLTMRAPSPNAGALEEMAGHAHSPAI